MKKEMSPIWGLMLTAALALPLVSCVSSDSQASELEAVEEDGKKDKEADAVPVEVAVLGRGGIESVLRFTTNLEAEREVRVLAEASRQVKDLLVEEGIRVRKGQVLLRLSDDEQRTTLAKVESELAKVEREYERQKRLFGQELISEEAFNEATYSVDQLKLGKEEAERALSYTIVRAPISGTITARHINEGDYVTVNQHLFDLVDFGSIVARVFVPEKELPRLESGQLARISAPALGDRGYSGEVERLAPIVDPKSGTVKVTVAIPRTAGLRPGMYVDVELVTDVVDEAVLVPKRALIFDDDQVYVYRMRGGENVERVRVQALLQDKDFVQPSAELAEGDVVVVAGQAGLKDGARVRVLETPKAAA